MKLEEAKQRLEDCVSNRDMKEIGGKYCGFYAVDDLIDEIYEDTQENIRCDGCIHKPDIGENFKEECGTCSRFYADGWEK